MSPRPAGLPFALRLAITNAWVSQLFDLELSKHGVAPFQSGTLMMIRRHEPVTPSELHASMGVPFTTVRNRVNELVRAGLVERTPNPQDRRSSLLRTTPYGVEMALACQAAARQVQRILRRAGIDVHAGLSDELDRLRTAAQDALGGTLSSARASLTTGPW